MVPRPTHHRTESDPMYIVLGIVIVVVLIMAGAAVMRRGRD